MKPNRDSAALAASLRAAADAPLPLPASTLESETLPDSGPGKGQPEQPTQADSLVKKKPSRVKDPTGTVQIALRPERDLLNRYVLAAAERTRKEGKVISAQQIMLQVLESGLKGHK
jgi:hypothetical protein